MNTSVKGLLAILAISLPTPAFALRVMLGEVSQVITQGQRVLPRKALDAGYAFKFSEVEGALRDLLAK